MTLAELLRSLRLSDGMAVAVAKNGEILPRSEWDLVPLEEGDTVEIVQPAAGG